MNNTEQFRNTYRLLLTNPHFDDNLIHINYTIIMLYNSLSVYTSAYILSTKVLSHNIGTDMT